MTALTGLGQLKIELLQCIACGSMRMTATAREALIVTRQIPISISIQNYSPAWFFRLLQRQDNAGKADGLKWLPFPCWWAAALLAVILGSGLLWGATGTQDHPLKFKPGQASASAVGRFSKYGEQVYFVFTASSGDHLRVNIIPLARELVTAGVLIYPSGREDGGPGGVVFDDDVNESGRYRIRVTTRPAGNPIGSFRVVVQRERQGHSQ